MFEFESSQVLYKAVYFQSRDASLGIVDMIG